MVMNVDLTFAAGYDIEMLEELPGCHVSNLFCFPPRDTGGYDGVLVRITPEVGGDWIGCFALGDSGIGRSAVVASPQLHWVFVISQGAGYAVNTACPSQWCGLECLPVRDIRIAADYEIILFADSTTIAAYGRRGILWRSERLCWDDLTIVGIDGSKIIGIGLDPTDSITQEGRFVVDLFTGAICESDFNPFD